MDTVKMIAGLDVGNGFVKAVVSTNGGEAVSFDFESGGAIETNSSGLKTKGSDIPMEVENIFNVMDVSFDTPAVESRTRRLLGQRGTHSGKAIEEFDVASTASKAQQDLSGILVLSSLAGEALRWYYHQHQALPDEVLPVDARIAVALPITEYKSYRRMYADKFRSVASHMVTIHNFEQPVRIQIVVSDVQVLAEGASAQYAIVQNGPAAIEAMMTDMRSHGVALKGISADDIINAENTIGIDIGEGTVNFPVFQDGRFNTDASLTFRKGYGTVLEQARERLQMSGMLFPSRKALSDFLMTTPNALNRSRYAKVLNVVNEEIEGFVHELCLQFRRVMSHVGSYVEVIYVYGGGSKPVKEQLYPALIKMVGQFGDADMTYPVLYLDPTESRKLNGKGLYLIANEVANAQAQA